MSGLFRNFRNLFRGGAGVGGDAVRGADAVEVGSDVAKGAARSVNPDLARSAKGVDDAGDAAKGARGTDDAGDAAGDAGKAGDGGKAKKSSFLERNAGNLLTAGIAAGGLIYLDQKYKDEKKKVKDCMKVCLPDNWDDHAYGDLDKSDLKYKELSDVGTAEQPICTAEIDECGAYCGDKCKEIHDYDAPGSNALRGLAGDAGEGLGGLLNDLFGGLFEGMGLDTSMVGYASSASSSMICMVLMIIILK